MTNNAFGSLYKSDQQVLLESILEDIEKLCVEATFTVTGESNSFATVPTKVVGLDTIKHIFKSYGFEDVKSDTRVVFQQALMKAICEDIKNDDGSTLEEIIGTKVR